MNKNIGIAVAAVLLGLAGNVSAIDFSELGGMTAARLSAAAASTEKGWVKPPPVPPAPTPCPADWLNGTAKPGRPVEWALLRGGGFTMGTNDNPLYIDANDPSMTVIDVFADAKPLRKVSIKEFKMSKTEVTVAQYRECYAKGECTCPKVALHKDALADSPITGITWEQANQYAKFAGGRLPTEAEWEYAATNEGQNVQYPWGNSPAGVTFGFNACNARTAVAHGGCGKQSPWPVCSMTGGNTWQGLCDMAGNVSEWVQDNYLPSYQGAPVDGDAVVVADSQLHVVRGGDFSSGSPFYRSDYRRHSSDASGKTGFRIARDSDQQR